MQAQKGLVAPVPPPADITETPPAEKPAGREFVWVPGYWAWDFERNTYIWVSGCWRAAPPNTYWVPGYWTRVEEGWLWVPGFWAPMTKSKKIEYLPPPPPIEYLGPPGPPPTADHIWVPPCWYWHKGRYVLRQGYWLVPHVDWVWVPSHYVWSPRGYIFVAGHWDYALPRRGILFAPIYFSTPVYERPGFSLSLGVVVDIGMLQFSLFTYPRYSHFYFGDYYDDVYISIGIFPRFECRRIYTWYDPIYVHDRWRHHKHRHDWDEHERREYDRRRVDKNLRPPRSYQEMKTRLSGMPESQRSTLEIAQPLSTVVAAKRSPYKFERIKPHDQERLHKEAIRVQTFVKDRGRWESAPKASDSAAPSAERRSSVAQPQQFRERPGAAQPSEAQPPPSRSRKDRETFSSERQTADSTVPRTPGLQRAEQVRIPDPPVKDRQRGPRVLREGPPSRPQNERSVDIRGGDRKRR